MCTAVAYKCENFYFGRTLDYEHSFSEKIVITARNFPLPMRDTDDISSHYAIIGMGIVSSNFPLYFDGVNEKGVSMAGLLFPCFSHYHPPVEGKINVASFEFISYILSQCSCVSDAKKLMENINITNTHFSEEFPSTPLHWIIADKSECVVAESTKDGLMVYDNAVGVLTNAPGFDSQMHNFSNYSNLSPKPPSSDFPQHSRGLGTVGMPGDFSSPSRFVRASFVKLNSPIPNTEQQCVNQFFHILESVQQIRGSVLTENGEMEYSQYVSCINADKGIYYYKTYYNSSLNAISLFDKDLDADVVYTLDLIKDWRLNFQT